MSPQGMNLAQLEDATGISSSEIPKHLSTIKSIVAPLGLQLVQGNKIALAVDNTVLQSINIKTPAHDTLSPTVLEVLAIIAYRQPITQIEIDELRGVSSEQSVKNLLEKELIMSTTRKQNAITISELTTTTHFLAHMGINSLTQLPKIHHEKEQQ